MNPARIAIIVVAGVAAIALALFVRNLAAPAKPPATAVHVAAAPPMARVLVAKLDLAVGDRLSAENMAWQPWPAATLNAAFITDGVAAHPAGGAAGALGQAGKMATDLATGGGPKMQAMIGDIVKERIYAGEPITDHKVVRAGQSGYLAVRLPPGMRALSLPITVDTAAGGFIQPGDHVDIMTTHPDTASKSGTMITEVVLANVLVLAIDQHTDSPKAGAALPGATITLEVPADSATIVARARTLGLTLALRSYADIGGETHGQTQLHAVRIFKGGAPAELVSAQ